MDFGLGLVGNDGYEQHHQFAQEKSKSYKNHGSVLIKQERFDPFEVEEGNRVSILAKRADDSGLISDHNKNNKQQMLSFSSSNQQTPFFDGMHGCIAGLRGTFTPAQWIELEHQAMIFKYFTANLPVPSNLLIPIRKAIQSAAFPGFSIGSYPFHPYGWGSFHLGFSGNTDPEPGRCRRTDGKKWRCSRDAVPDQKYCERHVNRGRHRSRKHVEGHAGQAASKATTTKKVPSMSTSMSSLGTSVGIVPGGVISQHQNQGLQPIGATNASSDPIAKRLNDQQSLSVMPTTIGLKTKDSQFSVPKQHASFNESSVSDFGIVSNDALLNPSQKNTYSDCGRYNSLMGFNTQQDQDQYPLRHFMDNWPKDQSQHSTISWPKDLKSDWTQLSMSIPKSTDFSLTSPFPSPSPSQEKDYVSQLRFDAGLEVGNSVGGPLGEALLNNATNAMGKGEIRDGSPQFGSSPTEVLRKLTFVSFSNSNSGESPMSNYEIPRSLRSAAHAMSPSIPSV